MRERPRKMEPPQFVSGWKDIANYLGKGVRTVQRYERQFGLPIRRPAGKPWGSVVATRAELDAWVNASPIREVFRLSGKSMPNEYASNADEFKRRIQEMMELHRQMLALRSEVRQSVKVLRNSLYGLQSGLNQYRLQIAELEDLSVPSEEEDHEELAAREEFDLLIARVDYPKAS